MVWAPFFREVVSLASEGLRSDLWGLSLRCPIHCQGSSLLQLGLSFAFGFLLATGLGLAVALYFSLHLNHSGQGTQCCVCPSLF